jgi:hypothetical protein
MWPDPNTPDCATVRDIVISVYNEGSGTMSQDGIINYNYVDSVLTFMQTRYPPVGTTQQHMQQIPNTACKAGTATPTPVVTVTATP